MRSNFGSEKVEKSEKSMIGWGPTFSVQKVVKGASKLKFGGQGFVSGIQVVVFSRKLMVWGSKII